MITISTKSANCDPENIEFFHQFFIFFVLEINCFPVLLSVRALLAKFPKRNKRKAVSGSRVTLPKNFACKPSCYGYPGSRAALPPCKQGLNFWSIVFVMPNTYSPYKVVPLRNYISFEIQVSLFPRR